MADTVGAPRPDQPRRATAGRRPRRRDQAARRRDRRDARPRRRRVRGATALRRERLARTAHPARHAARVDRDQPRGCAHAGPARAGVAPIAGNQRAQRGADRRFAGAGRDRSRSGVPVTAAPRPASPRRSSRPSGPLRKRPASTSSRTSSPSRSRRGAAAGATGDQPRPERDQVQQHGRLGTGRASRATDNSPSPTAARECDPKVWRACSNRSGGVPATGSNTAAESDSASRSRGRSSPAHGGTIGATANPDGGLTVAVGLPVSGARRCATVRE